MKKFRIQGSLFFSHINGECRFSILPSQTFKCPENKNAVFYPESYEKKCDSLPYAMLMPLKDGQVKDLKIDDEHDELKKNLINFIFQNKNIELVVLENENSEQGKNIKSCYQLKIIGFRFPVF